MDLVFNTPINRVSFGQCSINLLKEAKKQGHNVFLIPIGPVDLSTASPSEEFKTWVFKCIENATLNLDPSFKCIKLWHLAIPDEHIGFKGQYDRYCHNTTFISFYELDSPTQLEQNVARHFDTVFTNEYTCEVFNNVGVKTRYVPLGFDKDSFFVTNKRYFNDDRVVFCVLGKFEMRKHHQKIISCWVKRFGNNRRYYLQCAVYNPFFNPQMNANLIAGSTGGKHYWNINPIPFIPTNAAYNDFLNSNHIVLGMSGGEGWGLPEFQSVALGKHAVVLNAHGYKSWANEENAVLVQPFNKKSAIDGVFFRPNIPINQGNIFDWNEDEFISKCEEAIERYRINPTNVKGLEIQAEFTWEKTLNGLLNN